MILTLEVLGDQAAALGASGRKMFKAIGGTIGRLPDNDWVLKDPYISGRHALVRYLSGKFYIEDTSTNGVFINSPDNRLARDKAHPLQSGDLLYIDAYQIRVTLHREETAEDERDPFALLKMRGDETAAIVRTPARSDLTSSLSARPAELTEEDSETEWFGMQEVRAPKAATRTAGPRDEPDRAAPPVATPPVPIKREPPAVMRQTAPVQVASDSGSLQLKLLLDAAGLEGLAASDATAQTLGLVLRTAVEGLMEVLRARERVKDELRMRGTTFQPAHNNPLKFSANADDAFHNLLVKHNRAYLSPQKAFEDAFADVRDHQAALLGAMRIAFETMLAQFDPERLQEEFDRQVRKGSILGVPAKLRYWDLYRDKYAELAKDAHGSFRTLFGEEFAKAYEEQLEQFKAVGPRDR